MDNISAAYGTCHLDSIKLIRPNSNIHIVKKDKSHSSLQIWVCCHQEKFAALRQKRQEKSNKVDERIKSEIASDFFI